MKKSTRGESSKHACTHARSAETEARRVGETESKDYFGIGGDKPGQHRACVRKREKVREEKTGHKRSELRLASPCLALPCHAENVNGALRLESSSSSAAIMNLILHKRKRNDNERRVQVSELWIILPSSSYRPSPR